MKVNKEVVVVQIYRRKNEDEEGKHKVVSK